MAINAVQKGYRNESYPIQTTDCTMLNLIIYKREPGMADRIRRADSVANYLHDHGLPARHSADPRLMQLTAGNNTAYAGLYYYLPGQTIAWEAYTRRHLKQLGQTMGDMHTLLQQIPEPIAQKIAEAGIAAEYSSIVVSMRRYFAKPNVAEALHRKTAISLADPAQFSYWLALLQACRQLPRQQTLHMDFVRGNILFKDGEISGILDFEKAAFGHPTFDIARTLAFLLVDCKYKTEAQVRKYFLQSGYIKRGTSDYLPVSIKRGMTTILLLKELVNLFLFYDFYKFLRHNPYESLQHNEHFIRTRDLLVERKLLKFAKIRSKTIQNKKGRQ